MRAISILVTTLMFFGAALAQIGDKLEDAKASLGQVVDTYPFDGRSTEYEFKAKDGEITIVPIRDTVASVSFWLTEEPSEDRIKALLEEASGEDGWRVLPDRPASVTRNFPGKIPTHPNHQFYRSKSGKHVAAYSKGSFDRFIVTVVTSTFITDLKKLPSDRESNEAEQGGGGQAATRTESK